MRKLSKNDPLKNQQPQRWRTTIVIHFVSVLRWQKEKQRTSKDKQTERCKPANSKRRIQIDENEENILLQAKPTQKSRKKTRRKLHQQNLRPTVEKQRQRQLNHRQHRTTKTQTKRKTQTLLRKKRSDSDTPKKGNNSESESLCCGRGIFSVSVDTKPKTETTAEEKDPLAEEVQGQLTALSHSATNVTTESELRSRCQNRPRRRRTRTSTAPPSQRELFCLRCGAAPLIFRCFQRFGFAFLVFFDFFFRFSDFVHFYNFEKLKNWIW